MSFNNLKLITFFISFMSLSSPSYGGECRADGIAHIPGTGSPNAAMAAPGPVLGSWDNSEIADYSGDQLPGLMSIVRGADRFYSGPATDGFLLYGPYRSFTGISELALFSYIEFSTNWSPDSYQYCSNHKWRVEEQRSVCVERSTGYYDTSFVVDVVHRYNGNIATPIFSQVFKNINKFDHSFIYLPNIRCTGDVEDLEVRIYNPKGGSVDFTVHNLHMDARWRY